MTWSTNRRGIHYDTGKVGIGTDNPKEDLHVEGDIYIDGDAEFTEDIEVKGDVRIDGTLSGPTFTPTEDGLVPKPGTTTGRFLQDNGTWVEVPSTNGGQPLWSQNGDDITYNAGNVGIGGTPNEKLDVAGNIHASGNVTVDGQLSAQTFTLTVNGLVPAPTTTSGRFLKDDGTWATVPVPPPPTFTTQTAGLVPSPGGSTGRYLKDNGTWATVPTPPPSLWSQSGSNLHYSNGNVGIGTTNPSVKLDVSGNVRASGNVTVDGQLSAQTFTLTVNGLVPAPTTTSGRFLKDDGTWATVPVPPPPTFTTQTAGLVPSPGGSTGRYLKDNGTWATVPTPPPSLWSQSGSNLHYSNGNVGIGTTNPSVKLDVSGNVRASGNVTVDGQLSAQTFTLTVNGLVPAPTTTSGRFLKDDGTWAAPTIPTFTTTANGLVPNPGNATGRYLRDDGSWGTIALPAPSPWAKTGNDLHYSSGNIGIGTSSPTQKLDVRGSVRIGSAGKSINIYTSGSGTDIRSTHTLHLNYGDGKLVHVGADSGRGLRFQVTGNSRMTGSCTAASFRRQSDESLKSNIQDIRTPLQLVSQLRGRTYTRNATSSPETGFIAQEVQQALPDAVSEDDEGQKCVDYGSMIPVLVEAIKELDAKITAITA